MIRFFAVIAILFASLKVAHASRFEQNMDGIQSQVLESWKSNSGLSSFKLCLKNNLFFSDGTIFQAKDFIENITRFFQKSVFTEKSMSTREEGNNCARVVFFQSNKQYSMVRFFG